MAKKEINPEELMRDSEFLNTLKELGDDELVEAGKAFLKLDDFERHIIGLSLGIAQITKNRSFIPETQFAILLLNETLDDTQKKLLTFFFHSCIGAIKSYIKDKKDDETEN